MKKINAECNKVAKSERKGVGKEENKTGTKVVKTTKQAKATKQENQEQVLASAAAGAKTVSKKSTKGMPQDILEEISKDEPKSKANTATKTKEEEGRLRRAEYLRLKQRISEIEPTNYSKLYFIWQKGKWYRAFGHSAIIYHYDVCPKLKRKSKLLDDRDYGIRIPGGVINISDIEILEEKLEAVNIHKIKSDQRYYIFNLGQRYTDAEIKMFEKTKDRELASINQVVVPKEIFPHLYKLIRELQEKIYFSVAKMDRYAKDVFGTELVRRMNDVYVGYSLMVKSSSNSGGLPPEEYLKSVVKDMYWLQAQMGVATNMRVLEISKITQILRESGKIIREANLCMGKRLTI